MGGAVCMFFDRSEGREKQPLHSRKWPFPGVERVGLNSGALSACFGFYTCAS